MKAFPRPASDAHQHGMHPHQEGMDLRDYFAAAALQGLVSNPEIRQLWAMFAADAYEIADAMMKERKQNGQGN